MRGWATVFLSGALLLAMGVDARAGLVVANFNDLTAGTINGQAGGTGFTGNWTGSTGGTVFAGDLSSANYNEPQTGTALRYRNANSTGLRQNFRTPTASTLTNTVWFSFLAMAETTGDRAGLSINAATGTPFADPGTVYAYFTGDTLNYSFGTGTANTLAAAAPLASTALVVGKLTISSSGADGIQLWVNPDLIANPDITTITPVYSSNAVDFLSSITTLGAVAARRDTGTSGGGDVDSIRFSDGGGNSAQAYYDVTGIPEPSSLLCITSLAGIALLRRPRARRSS